jgi:nucleoside-diphosphate-sugar epimerase
VASGGIVSSEAPRALVTGANGFVGRRLAERLVAQGWSVHVVLRAATTTAAPAGAHVHRHDGTTAQLIAIAAAVKPAVTFHLASLFLAEHGPEDVVPLIRTNVEFGAQLLEAVASAGCRRFAEAGTTWQHFGGADYDPVCLYAATKQAFADVLAYWVAARGFAATSLQLTDTYGPGDGRVKLIPMLLQAAREGRRVALSPGEQRLDLVHVDDVVEAFFIAGRRLLEGLPPPGHREVYTVSSGHPMRLRDVVELLRTATGLPIDVEWGARSYRPREVMEPWTGPTLPGWSPRIALRDGLAGLES